MKQLIMFMKHVGNCRLKLNNLKMDRNKALMSVYSTLLFGCFVLLSTQFCLLHNEKVVKPLGMKYF